MSYKVSPMWQVGDVFYHYSDKERASKEFTPKLVWVVMDYDYFIGTWQIRENFAHGVFDSEEEALKHI